MRIIQRQFFLFLNKNICCDPSLEPSRRDGSVTYRICPLTDSRLGAPLMEEQGNKKAIAPIEVGEREPRFREEVLESTCDCRPARFVRIVSRCWIASEGTCGRSVGAELLQFY